MYWEQFNFHPLVYKGIQSTKNGVKGCPTYCKFLMEQRLVIRTVTTKYKKKGKKHIYITNSSFSFMLSIQQNCMRMAANSQTSKRKVLHENGSIPLSITVCSHLPLPFFIFCHSMKIFWFMTGLTKKREKAGVLEGRLIHLYT